MTTKKRLTVTVDPVLVAAGTRAVAAGEAPSLSAWVSTALADRSRRDDQLRALAAAVEHYEAEHGLLTDDEIDAVRRADREHAVVVRGSSPVPKSRRGRAKRAS